MSVLAIVPARGGSKGVPLKNLHPLNGIPLIGHIGSLIEPLSEAVSRWVVSTDHEEIANVAESFGIAAPFRRPHDLSGDRVGDLPVLKHALETMETIDAIPYEVILMIQPTSPLRKVRHIIDCLERIESEPSVDAVWTISPTDAKFHPLKQLCLGAGGNLVHFDERGSQVIARQQLQPVYHRNGCCYAFTRRCLLDLETILPPRSAGVVVEEPTLSIDTFDDFRTAEKLLDVRNR